MNIFPNKILFNIWNFIINSYISNALYNTILDINWLLIWEKKIYLDYWILR